RRSHRLPGESGQGARLFCAGARAADGARDRPGDRARQTAHPRLFAGDHRRGDPGNPGRPGASTASRLQRRLRPHADGRGARPVARRPPRDLEGTGLPGGERRSAVRLEGDDTLLSDQRARLHARQDHGGRQHGIHRQLQPVACWRGQRGEPARARQRDSGRPIRRIHRRPICPLRGNPCGCATIELMARRHNAALSAGSLLSVAALLPPAIGFADRRLSLHMLLQMLLLALVIPLLAYGAQPLIGGSLARLHPIAGILALNVVLFGSQLPAVLDLTAKHLMLGEAAQAAFMTGAFLFWSPIVRPGGLTPIAKIGYLMVAGVPPTLPGITLALSHHLFYQAYRSIEDQQIAGLLLFGTAKFALVAGTFVIL